MYRNPRQDPAVSDRRAWKNTSGKTGVHWSKSQNAWCVMIGFQNKRKNLGYFKSYDDAVACRIQAEKEHFKDYRVQNEKP